MKSYSLFVLLAVTVSSLLFLSCAPSDSEIRAMVQAEIAKIEIPAGEPGQIGPQGERGDTGAHGETGPSRGTGPSRTAS